MRPSSARLTVDRLTGMSCASAENGALLLYGHLLPRFLLTVAGKRSGAMNLIVKVGGLLAQLCAHPPRV